MFYCIFFVRDWYLKDLFILKQYSHRYRTQRMCEETVVDYLAILKFIPYCFVKSKMIKKLHTTLYADDDE